MADLKRVKPSRTLGHRDEPPTGAEPVTAPEPLTAEEWTLPHRTPAAIGVGGGVVAACVKLVGVHAFLDPSVVIVAVAVLVFVAGVLFVTRNRSSRN